MNHFSKFSVLQKMPFVIRTFASKSFLKGGGRKEVAKIDDRVFQNMSTILRTFTKKSCQKGGEGADKSGGFGKSGCGGKDGKCSGDQPKDSSAGPPKAKKSNENKSCRRGPSMSHFEAAKWRRISLYNVLPALLIFTIFTFATVRKHERPEFVPYEHLRKRDKKFFWGDGNHTFFHNKHVNALPEGYEED